MVPNDAARVRAQFNQSACISFKKRVAGKTSDGLFYHIPSRVTVATLSRLFGPVSPETS